MSKFQRVRIINQQLVAVPAAKAWEWLTDWAGTGRARRTTTSGDLALLKIVLHGDPNKTPRTRVMEFGSFGTIRETLLYQDDEFRHLYYNMEGVGPYGIRNYLATTDIDEISENASQITITARFDVPPSTDVLKAQALINQAHNDSVIGGIRRYYAKV
ncbi:MAG TPA: SRPBCC family protein [Steroidobacteraceae bacterium]|jgi:hypothetical protein